MAERKISNHYHVWPLCKNRPAPAGTEMNDGLRFSLSISLLISLFIWFDLAWPPQAIL